MSSRVPRIAIIGAGPGGLCTGKRLLDEGFTDFVILERATDVGGTWNRNRYPGCECDVPSALYSFSFEFKADWSKPYGTQPEILAYMQGIADKYGLRPHCRFGDGVAAARWNETTASWTLTLDSGDTVEADVVVSAIGMFNDLHWPDIEGLDSFAGAMWHSAQWDWNHDLRGDRVAVIGSAASAVQFVPEIVKVARQVHLFQRTANWVLPKIDGTYTPEELDALPGGSRAAARVPRRSRAQHEPRHDVRRPEDAGRARSGGSGGHRRRARSRRARQAPADASVRVQAPVVLEPLFPGVQRAEPGARHASRSLASPRTVSRPSTAPNARSTPSSSPPASRRRSTSLRST